MRRLVLRVIAASGLAAFLFGAIGLLAAPAAFAHPLGNFTINHASELSLTPGHLRVTYALDMAEIPTFQQHSAIDANGDGAVTPAERAAWAGREARSVLPLLWASVGGSPVSFSDHCGETMVFRPGQGGLSILRMVAVFDASIPSAGRLEFRDLTFGDRIGWKEVTAAGSAGVRIQGSTVPALSPSRELLRYPANLLQSPLAITEAHVMYTSTGGGGGVLPVCPGSASAAPKAAGSAFAALVTWRLTPVILIASLLLAFAFGVLHALGPGHGKTITAAYLVGSGARMRQAVGVGVAVATMHTLSVLTLGLFAVVLSASFPADRIYPWLTVATGAVALGLGGAMLTVRTRALRRGGVGGHGHAHPWDAHGHAHPEAHTDTRAHSHHHGQAHQHRPAMEHDDAHDLMDDREPERLLVGAAVGAATVAPRGPADRAGPAGLRPTPVALHHLGGEARYRDEPDEPGGESAPDTRTGSHTNAIAETAVAPVSRPRLMALAVSGGILPSPTALVVLLAAIAAHRVAYGLGLIAAFSAGLAAALVAIAVLALRARAVVGRRLGSGAAAILPVVSAAVIVGFGLFFLVRGVAQVGF